MSVLLEIVLFFRFQISIALCWHIEIHPFVHIELVSCHFVKLTYSSNFTADTTGFPT